MLQTLPMTSTAGAVSTMPSLQCNLTLVNTCNWPHKPILGPGDLVSAGAGLRADQVLYRVGPIHKGYPRIRLGRSTILMAFATTLWMLIWRGERYRLRDINSKYLDPSPDTAVGTALL